MRMHQEKLWKVCAALVLTMAVFTNIAVGSCTDSDSCTATCSKGITNQSCTCSSNTHNTCVSTANCSCDSSGNPVTSCDCEHC